MYSTLTILKSNLFIFKLGQNNQNTKNSTSSSDLQIVSSTFHVFSIVFDTFLFRTYNITEIKNQNQNQTLKTITTIYRERERERERESLFTELDSSFNSSIASHSFLIIEGQSGPFVSVFVSVFVV